MIACMCVNVMEISKSKVTFNPKLMEHGKAEPPEIHKLCEVVQISGRNNRIVG